MARQNISQVWAAAGSKTDPGGVKVLAGWNAEIPPYQYFNWWKNRVDQMLEHLEKNGVAVWDTNTVYAAEGLALGSDGVLYQAVLSQSGNNPTTDGGTNWRSLVCDGDFTEVAGYVVFNSRPALIIQWGTVIIGANLTDTEYPVALPVAFPNVFAAAVGSDNVTNDTEQDDVGVRPNGLASIYIQNAEDVSSTVRFICIGW